MRNNMFPIDKNSEKLKIAYKLLNDLLLASGIFFLFVMLAEGALSGIISRYVSVYYLALIIFLEIFAIGFLGKMIGASFSGKLDKKTAIIILAVAGLYILNSVFKFGWIASPLIIILSLISIYLLYQVLEKE